jgi:hypothetical protein
MTKLSGRHFSVGLTGLASAPGVTGKLAYLRHAAARGVYLLADSWPLTPTKTGNRRPPIPMN